MMQKELPLWSVVDSFSLGLLSHAVVQSYASGTIPESGDAEKLLLYKKTAERMGVNHKHFEGRLKVSDHSEKPCSSWFSPLDDADD